MLTILEVIFLSLAVASIAFTVTEMNLFKSIREWILTKNHFIGKIFSCGYCFGHWLAFGVTFLYQPRLFYFWWPLDYFLTAIVIAWLAGIQWIIMCTFLAKTDK